HFRIDVVALLLVSFVSRPGWCSNPAGFIFLSTGISLVPVAVWPPLSGTGADRPHPDLDAQALLFRVAEPTVARLDTLGTRAVEAFQPRVAEVRAARAASLDPERVRRRSRLFGRPRRQVLSVEVAQLDLSAHVGLDLLLDALKLLLRRFLNGAVRQLLRLP